MYDLTQRQIEILKKIIEEYLETAEAVGSETLEKKYDLGVSPATIRNEMAVMVKLGYLKKPHSSAGRVPTPKALKFYVTELMPDKKLTTADEVKAKEKIFDQRGNSDQFLREVVRDLARSTHTLAIAVTDNGNVYYAGYPHILDMPEFYDIDVTKNFLTLIDNMSFYDKFLEEAPDDFSVLLGEELGAESYNPYGLIISRFNTRSSHRGIIGVAGPARLAYPRIVPYVRYYGTLVEELADW